MAICTPLLPPLKENTLYLIITLLIIHISQNQHLCTRFMMQRYKLCDECQNDVMHLWTPTTRNCISHCEMSPFWCEILQESKLYQWEGQFFRSSHINSQRKKQKILANRNRTSDRWIAITLLQSTALPTELSRDRMVAPSLLVTIFCCRHDGRKRKGWPDMHNQ
jgi:hypothetical protein